MWNDLDSDLKITVISYEYIFTEMWSQLFEMGFWGL